MLVKDLISKLREWHKPEDHLAVHIWSVDDVLGTAEEMGVKLSLKDANSIIDDIDGHIDSELGITWETIRCSIENYLEVKANG